MLEIRNKTIFLTRGDTADITFVPRIHRQGTLRPLEATDTCIFRLEVDAKTVIEINCVVDYEFNVIHLHLVPNNTLSLKPKTYKYELELVTAGDDHYTFVADSDFIIGKEIERHGV